MYTVDINLVYLGAIPKLQVASVSHDICHRDQDYRSSSADWWGTAS